MTRTLILIIGIAASMTWPSKGRADDWPQWRGRNRNGISTEKGWLESWPAGENPRILWTADVGKGHSAISVKDSLAYTLGWDGEHDTVYCFDAATGAPRWKQSYACKTILQWPGPRTTPTVDGGRVYTLGQHGQLNAYDARTGNPIWSRQLPESYNPDVDYGFAWSPLIEDGLLILSAGSRGLALDKETGRDVWGNDGQHGACASPVPFEYEGRRGIALIITDQGRDSVRLIGVEPASGQVLWKGEPWVEKWGAACCDPIVADGKVFIATAEQHVRCARFTIRRATLAEDWSNSSLPIYTGGCVLVGGSIFGITKAGILKALDWNTGRELWAQRGFGEHGTLIAADSKLIVQASRGGTLSVVAADGKGFRELRRAKVFDKEDETFTAPVLANGRIYCRSYGGKVVCLEVGAGRAMN